MDLAANTIQNKMLVSLTARASTSVMNAITKASARTGVNFAYMVQQASAESNFDQDVKAKTSSASGLYQFIESTWLSMVKKHGAAHGMAAEAAQIGVRGKVADKSARKEILELRNDPEKASAMAAEFARENESFLKSHWGGKVGPTELYFAHFMGAGGASAFLKARDADPAQSAAVIFPAAARANRNVFYDTKTGRPKTMDEVYAFFDRKFEIKNADISTAFAENDAKPEGGQRFMGPSIRVDENQDSAASRTASLVFKNNTVNALLSDAPAAGTGTNYAFAPKRYNALVPTQTLMSNPVEIMFLSQLGLPTVDRPSKVQ
ncbi:MAG: flagellar biosynthesis protein FlgJ [Alphaproteobacteria bacterium]